MKYVAKQELKQVPFQILHEKVTLAGRRAVESLVKNEKEAHSRLLTRKMQEYNDTHEAPYEGNFEDIYPYVGPSEDIVKKERTEAEREAFKDAAKYLGLKEKASWLLPQVTAYIAKLPLFRVDGKIDGARFLQDNFSKDDWHKGLYRYCTPFQRGLIVPSQNSIMYRNYSALVPLLMMPFKKFDGIEYSSWINTSNVLDPQLYLAMELEPYDLQVDGNPEGILNARNKGLQYQSGDKKGTSRNPVSSFKLYGLRADSPDHEEEALAGMPWLAQVMNAQIWMAHPTIRTNLMVLNGEHWDDMPSPLIESDPLIAEVGIGEENVSSKYAQKDLDWLS